MTPICEFYDNNGYPYKIEDIIQNWTNDDWELHHDFIQWVFPLKEASQFNPDAPILTDEDIQIFQDSFLLPLKLVFTRFLYFLGLEYSYDEDGYEIVPSANFSEREYIWKIFNHNHLRITRCLQSCILLGLEDEALHLFDCLTVLKDRYNISDNTFKYWSDAAFSNIKFLTSEEIKASRQAVENGQILFEPQELE